MAGYIGSKTSVTVISPQTDSRYVNTTGDTMSGSLAVNGSVTASYANFNGNGVPAIINSANGNDYKVSLVHAGTQASYLGANASNAFMVGNSSATGLMSVDSSGRIIAPAQPAFSAWNLATGSHYATSVNTWDTADNILNNWSSPRWSAETNIGSSFNTSNGRFTAPVAGKYRIFASSIWWLAGVNTYMTIFKNGTQGSPYATATGTSVYIPLVISRVMTLSANDTLEIGFYIQSSSNFIPGGGYLSFSGELIG